MMHSNSSFTQKEMHMALLNMQPSKSACEDKHVCKCNVLGYVRATFMRNVYSQCLASLGSDPVYIRYRKSSSLNPFSPEVRIFPERQQLLAMVAPK